jgi:hypothetical protein
MVLAGTPAGWHQASLVKGFKNANIIKLPPYSPELNPIEQVWSWLRQHHLANRCFSGYIVDACTLPWNDFVSNTLRVTKMCSRDWLEVEKNLMRIGITLYMPLYVQPQLRCCEHA